ncbi:MAG TPA: DNA polymerase III subunit gamma/tau [Alphaproteobacteria bacterium]|nr:DNA polymerase III subunit gamma/tau [Alphaproteobacteria bacterium]
MSSVQQEKQAPYRVLARKYRPQNFDDLIGQDALVRTLKNAIDSGRIAHAFMLTGIRGVGKTTTARIIAKALNYTGTDGKAGPTTGDTADCDICKAIAEDRHPDVMEMDAASRTGIDDIREILDGVRYAPTSARYKVYIIDEVHMLSKAAFNALLKTLEEPPEHVKFIFATTEIRKVPITVLSRCQRFDLRRIEPDVLQNYYGQIAEKENVKAEEDALALIARAADGSVRDGLSLLDQAIALGDGMVTGAQVKDMLGLADRALILDLLENALKGKSADALAIMGDLYKKGADPVVVMQDMLELTHQLTKHRALPQNAMDSALPKGEQDRLVQLSDSLSMPTLGRTWQILLKGLGEVNMAPHPQKAAEMIVIRLLYAAELPDPTDLVQKLKDQPANTSSKPAMQMPANNGGGSNVTIQKEQSFPSSSSVSTGETVAALKPQSNLSEINLSGVKTIQDVVSLLEQNGEMILATHVMMYVHPVKVEEGLIEFGLAENSPPRLSQDLSQKLKAITGKRWVITISSQMGAPTLMQLRDKAEAELQAHVLGQTLVKNILNFFPDAKLNEITKK